MPEEVTRVFQETQSRQNKEITAKEKQYENFPSSSEISKAEKIVSVEGRVRKQVDTSMAPGTSRAASRAVNSTERPASTRPESRIHRKCFLDFLKLKTKLISVPKDFTNFFNFQLLKKTENTIRYQPIQKSTKFCWNCKKPFLFIHHKFTEMRVPQPRLVPRPSSSAAPPTTRTPRKERNDEPDDVNFQSSGSILIFQRIADDSSCEALQFCAISANTTRREIEENGKKTKRTRYGIRRWFCLDSVLFFWILIFSIKKLFSPSKNSQVVSNCLLKRALGSLLHGTFSLSLWSSIHSPYYLVFPFSLCRFDSFYSMYSESFVNPLP